MPRSKPRRQPGGKAVVDEEASVREVNATAWEPMPGMVKLRCRDCCYFFAAPRPDTTDNNLAPGNYAYPQ
jgi:hypothetical protein